MPRYGNKIYTVKKPSVTQAQNMLGTENPQSLCGPIFVDDGFFLSIYVDDGIFL
jgi:hypothetical protein